jgi:hypothetical protein
MESLLMVQAHHAQSGAYSSPAWGEDRARKQYQGVLEDALGEKWRKGLRKPYHLFW